MTALAEPSPLILRLPPGTLPRGAADRSASRRLAWLGAAVVLATVLVFQWRWNAPGLDDAWITYRYARNIAAGRGWVYNAGERLQGGSTPLYTLWLAACGACGISIPAASAVTCCLATCGTTLLIFRFLARRQNVMVGLSAVVLVLFSPFLRTVTGGMETALYVFLCVSALFCAGSGNWRTSFIVAGLAMFTRLDGAAVLAVVAFWRLVERRRFPVKELIFPVALNLLWFAFAAWYFGKSLPNSFYAKRFHSGHAHFSWWMIRAILRLPPAYCLLAVAGVGWTLRANGRAMLPLVLWAGGYVAAYSLSQLEFYAWYVTPMVVVVCVLAAVGVGRVAEMILGAGREDRQSRAEAPDCLAASLARRDQVRSRDDASGLHDAVGRASQARRLNARSPRAGDAANHLRAAGSWRAFAIASLAAITLAPAWADARRQEDQTLERARYEGAIYARSHVPRGAVIEAAGIGQIGWWTDNCILDAAGLVSPQTLANRPAPWFWHALGDVADHERPGFIFDSVEAKLGWPAAVTRSYHAVAIFPHDNEEFTPFVLWERNP